MDVYAAGGGLQGPSSVRYALKNSVMEPPRALHLWQ